MITPQQRNQLVTVGIIVKNWYVNKTDVELSLGKMYTRGQYIRGSMRIYGQKEACAYVPAGCRKMQPSLLLPSPGKGLKNMV